MPSNSFIKEFFAVIPKNRPKLLKVRRNFISVKFTVIELKFFIVHSQCLSFFFSIINIKAINAVYDAVVVMLETRTRLCLCDDLYTRKHWGKSACSFIGFNWILWLFFVRKNEKCLVHIYKRFTKVYISAWQRKILPRGTAWGRGKTASLFTKVDSE